MNVFDHFILAFDEFNRHGQIESTSIGMQADYSTRKIVSPWKEMYGWFIVILINIITLITEN